MGKENIPLRDRRWFLSNSCEMSTEEAVELALQMAECVSPIYNERYPNDDRVSECIEGVRAFRAGKIGEEELRRLRDAADAAAAAYAARAANLVEIIINFIENN